MPAPTLTELPYHRDSALLLRAMHTLPGSVMLDSGLKDQEQARYDIISAQPCTELLLFPDRLQVTNAVTREARLWPDTDIFRCLEQLLPAETTQHPELAELPFQGGALFSLGYESRRDLIRFRHESDNQQAIAWAGIYNWAIIVDHHTQRTRLFFLPDCPETTRQRVQGALTGEAKAVVQPFRLKQTFQPASNKVEYSRAFGKLKAFIEAGDCYQANLAQSFSGNYEGDPLDAYLALRQVSHSPFSAWFSNPADGATAALSLSPERFIAVREGEVLTQPIKGTRPRSSDPDEDRRLAEALSNSEKDRAENLMIVDLLRNDLGSICEIGSVQTPELFALKSFTSVHHLISTVTGKLVPANQSSALLRACFPGGSITGAPKIRAMQIIDSLETEARRLYCGSIGYISYHGNMDCNIAIRTLLCEQGRIYCRGGGGIVADSDCDQEYAESINKIALLISTLESNINASR